MMRIGLTPKNHQAPPGRKSLAVLFWLPLLVGMFNLGLFPRAALAHDPRLDLPDPQSIPEAWSVILECAANVDQLLDQGLLPDLALQIANTSAPIRLLQAHATDHADKDAFLAVSRELMTTGFDVILAGREKVEPLRLARAKWLIYRQLLKKLESHFPPESLRAIVYICPMHPHDRHLTRDEKCTACGMALVRRHIPASSVYEKPGEPSMKLTVTASPLEVEHPAVVKIRLTKADNSPVSLADLVEVHTQKIHLLINDRSLTDYHHEHPRPTDVPGEYAFTFTPIRPGPYRIWADVVPATTSIQEYILADIPADTSPAPLSDRESIQTAIVAGRKYELNLLTDGKPIRAGQTITGTIAVTGADGQPFIKLEPVMGAFAHLVGFSEDLKTVIHIHPWGREPTKADDRGGPAFSFRLYAPTAGFLRLYGQVQIEGVSQFAPFGLTILPAEKATISPAMPDGLK